MHVAAVSSVVTGGAVTTYEDELLDSVEGPERTVGTDAVPTQRYSGVPDNADTTIQALSPATDEDGLLLRTGVEGAGAETLTRLQGMKDVGASMVAAQAAEDVLPLLSTTLRRCHLQCS